MTGHTECVCALNALDNGDLVSGSDDCTIKIWNPETGAIKKDIEATSIVTSFVKLQNEDLVCASDKWILILD